MRDYDELVKRLKQSDDNCNAEHNECPAECDSPGYTIFLEAADAIEELVAATPKWISVEERLPEDYSRVLGFMAWGGMMLLERQSKGWYFADRIQQAPDEAVLYWMPLPAPPKEVK